MYSRQVSSRLPVESRVTTSETPVPPPHVVPAGAPAPPPAVRIVEPPAPAPMPAPPTRVVGPPQLGAAVSNSYAERVAERDAGFHGRREHVVQPEQYLVHAWTFAIRTFPPSALTIWLQRTVPAENGYQFYIQGEEIAADPYPDRKLYDVIRSRRRQPAVAETFVGRIRGLSSEGSTLDVGGGSIQLPPDPQQAAPTWAPSSGAPPPWAYGGAPPPGMPFGYGYGAPPGGGQPAPWGMPPWWAMMPPWMMGQQQTPPVQTPPASIAHDPALVEIWKSVMSLSTTTAQGSNEAQARAATEQSKLVHLLFSTLLEREKGGKAESTGGIKDTLELFRSMAGLVKEMQGGGGDEDGLKIHEIGGGDKIFSTGGKVDKELTAAYAIKTGLEGIAKGVGGKWRASATVQPAAANGAAPRTSSSSLPAASSSKAPNDAGK